MASLVTGPLVIILMLGGGGLPFPMGVPPLAEDPELLKAVPAGSLFMVEWFGTGTPDAASRNAVERLAASPDIRALATTIKNALRNVAAAEAPPEMERLINEGMEALAILGSRPGCLFLSDLVLQPPQPLIHAGLVVNAGDRAADLGRVMRELEHFVLDQMGGGGMRPQPATIEVRGATFRVMPLPPHLPPVAWGFAGPYLILAVGQDMPETILASMASGGGLGADADFTALRTQVAVERPSLRAYVDLARVLRHVADMGGSPAAALLDALGLNGVRAIIAESGLEGETQTSKTLIATRGVAAGLLRLAEGAPLTDDELALIPGDATFAGAFRLSPSTLYREFLTVLGGIDPRAREEFLREVPRDIERELGLKLEDDILAPLGDAWCLWSSPGQGGLLFTGLTAAVPVKDREAVVRLVNRIEAIIREEAGDPHAGGGRRPRRGVYLDTFTYKGTRIAYLNPIGEDFPAAPAWCLTDRHLLISAYPQMLKAALDRGYDVESSIANRPEFKHRAPALALTYVDTRAVVELLYPVLHPLAVLGLAELQREGLDISIAALPSAAGILPHLRPDVGSVSRVEAGILSVSRGTLPNLGPIGGGLVPVFLFSAGFLSARAVHAPPHAVATAHMHQLMQLRNALEMYRLDHGAYPDTLAPLSPYLPMPRDGRAADAYEYYGYTAHPRDVVAACREPHGGMRHVLFVDGSVATLPENQFQERVRRRTAPENLPHTEAAPQAR